MKIMLQISSGSGPEECARMVALTAAEVEKGASDIGLSCVLAEALPSRIEGNFHSLCFWLEGEEADAYATSWEGSVQWIWQSEYRAGHRRKNWYVKVTKFALNEERCFDLKDVKIESMRASGPGGQHVNKTASAVRATHIPTGKTAFAQESRSQHINKKLALLKLALLFETDGRRAEAEAVSVRRLNHYTIERGEAATVRVYDAATKKRKK